MGNDDSLRRLAKSVNFASGYATSPDELRLRFIEPVLDEALLRFDTKAMFKYLGFALEEGECQEEFDASEQFPLLVAVEALKEAVDAL